MKKKLLGLIFAVLISKLYIMATVHLIGAIVTKISSLKINTSK